MTTPTRKRKLSSLDSDSPTKIGVTEMLSVMRSQRKKPAEHLNKENCPSPRKSPRRPTTDSPAKSPCKSLFKPSTASSSFYGKQQPVYLSPLDRKAIKESLPSPPLPSPPPEVEKKNKKGGGKKKRKATAGSKNAGKMGLKNPSTSSKMIKLCELNTSVTAKPPSPTPMAPTSSNTKQSESRKAISFTFSSMKPKLKIFVGAAFFGTGKKPTSMYKKSVPKSSTKPASVPVKSKAVLPETKSEQSKLQSLPAESAVQPVEVEEKQPTSKQRVRFDPTDWVDSVDELSEAPQPLRCFTKRVNSHTLRQNMTDTSPKMLAEKFGITKELKIVLTKTPTPSPTSSASSLCVQYEPTSGAASPPKESTALYPIFGSASKRLRKALQPPVSCSTPAGSITPLQTPSAKERTLRRRKEKQDDDQLIIDAGQKQFGATTCNSCGMVYSADNLEDNFQHTQFHQRFLDSIRFVGWKKERVVAEFWDGKILLVMPDDPKYATKKAEDVRRVADSELGFQQVTLSRPTQAKTYLFISTERMVMGCLVAEPIRQAFRVLEQPDRYKDMTKDDFMERHRAWCCSTVPEEALCGISRIWVFSVARRRSIATRMLDTVRSTFMYGSHLTKEEIAFSDPTPDGKLFATKYCNTPTFLVYNFIA